MRRLVAAVAILAVGCSGSDGTDRADREPACADLVGETTGDTDGCWDGETFTQFTVATCADGRALLYTNDLIGVEGDPMAEREGGDDEIQTYFGTCS